MKYLLSIYYTDRIPLGIVDTIMNNNNKSPCPHGVAREGAALSKPGRRSGNMQIIEVQEIQKD